MLPAAQGAEGGRWACGEGLRASSGPAHCGWETTQGLGMRETGTVALLFEGRSQEAAPGADRRDKARRGELERCSGRRGLARVGRGRGGGLTAVNSGQGAERGKEVTCRLPARLRLQGS